MAMAQIELAYLERERLRFMRPDAQRFVRSDWRRYVALASPLGALYESYERKYSPDQPRVPAGQREGGQWTSDGSGASVILVAGHHFVPKGIFEKMPLQPETKKVFENRTTGPLQDRTSNYFDKEHRLYNDAVGEELNKFMQEKVIRPEQMTPEQAGEFVDKIVKSGDPRIRGLNLRMYMRGIMRMMRRSRGGE